MRTLESAFERDRALSKGLLDEVVRSTYLYSLRLASTSQICCATGEIINIDEPLAPFRQWLRAHMIKLSETGWQFTEDQARSGIGTRYWCGKWHRSTLVPFYPVLIQKLKAIVGDLLKAYPQLDEPTLQSALDHKRLALALGGGGGTGFAHHALFQCLEKAKIQPAAITGTSIGALMGFTRALQPNYDAASAILKMPSWWRLARNFSPSFHKTKHGLPAFWNFDFLPVIESFVKDFGWSDIPRFDELKIPFACITSGITRDPKIIKTFESKTNGLFASLINLTKLTWKSVCDQATQIGHMLMAEHATREIVLGFDDLTKNMSTGDAIPFSALVPGVITYEVPRNHYKSIEILNEIFEREHLYRFTDGGLAGNVPASALRRQINTLAFRNTNFYVLAVDVFAPQLNDGFFYPLEQIANTTADQNAHSADSFLRLKNLLSPMNLSPTLRQFKWLNTHFLPEFATELKVIEYAVQPLRALPRLLHDADS